MTKIAKLEVETAEKLPSSAELDWSAEALWLSFAATLTGPTNPAEGVVKLATADGRTRTLDAAILVERFVNEDATGNWLPVFFPVQAVFFKERATFMSPQGKNLKVEAGGAVVKDGKEFFVISAEEYDKDYEVVGHRGTKRPISPFRQYPRDDSGW
jgi:hypothetical protein